MLTFSLLLLIVRAGSISLNGPRALWCRGGQVSITAGEYIRAVAARHAAQHGERCLHTIVRESPRKPDTDPMLHLNDAAEHLHAAVLQKYAAAGGVSGLSQVEENVLEVALHRSICALLFPLLDAYLQLAADEAMRTFNGAVGIRNEHGAESSVYEDNFLASACMCRDDALRQLHVRLVLCAKSFGGGNSTGTAPSIGWWRRLRRAVDSARWKLCSAQPQSVPTPYFESPWDCSNELLSGSIALCQQRVQSALDAFVAAREAQCRVAGVLPRHPRLFSPVNVQLHALFPHPFGIRDLRTQIPLLKDRWDKGNYDKIGYDGGFSLAYVGEKVVSGLSDQRIDPRINVFDMTGFSQGSQTQGQRRSRFDEEMDLLSFSLSHP